ncbi:hypothetical protein [Streptomyces sp. MMG1121]|uniref:hypothetical protein n=1 Tax=Streptomyces sp. MMG1121 TaxID=1415544 RepID=UPI0006B06897|nr:hypothetical protein ADK64_19495 [Streptomyces sp. MMG1121]
MTGTTLTGSRAGAEAVRAVNRLTRRWAAASAQDGTVFSAAGVWPLLAFLAEGAAGRARAEPAGAGGGVGDGSAAFPDHSGDADPNGAYPDNEYPDNEYANDAGESDKQ